MTSPQRLLSIAQVDLGDGYSDFRELADGSNSLVCSAVRRADCKEVAIKIIDCRFLLEDSMEIVRLVRELESLEYFTQTKAGQVIEIYSSYYNSADCILYCVTEKMDFSLDHLLDIRPLTMEEAKTVFYEISLITAFEHRCAWAHRDRKPDNVLFSVKGGVLHAMQSLGIIQNVNDPVTTQEKEAFLKRFSLKETPCVFKDCDMGLSRYVGKIDAPALPSSSKKQRQNVPLFPSLVKTPSTAVKSVSSPSSTHVLEEKSAFCNDTNVYLTSSSTSITSASSSASSPSTASTFSLSATSSSSSPSSDATPHAAPLTVSNDPLPASTASDFLSTTSSASNSSATSVSLFAASSDSLPAAFASSDSLSDAASISDPLSGSSFASISLPASSTSDSTSDSTLAASVVSSRDSLSSAFVAAPAASLPSCWWVPGASNHVVTFSSSISSMDQVADSLLVASSSTVTTTTTSTLPDSSTRPLTSSASVALAESLDPPANFPVSALTSSVSANDIVALSSHIFAHDPNSSFSAIVSPSTVVNAITSTTGTTVTSVTAITISITTNVASNATTSAVTADAGTFSSTPTDTLSSTATATTPHTLLRQLSSKKLAAEKSPPMFLRHCSTLVNTPSYRPWEIVAKEVDHVQFANLAPLPIDMWANGVILVELLLGERAFNLGKASAGKAGSESTTELKALLQALPLSEAEKSLLSTECFQKRSSGQEFLKRANCVDSLYDKLQAKGCDNEALSLVRGLLAVDPNARFTALQVLEHPWLHSVRQSARESTLFSSVGGVPSFDQDQFMKLSLSSQVSKFKSSTYKVFTPNRRLTTAFFKGEAKQKGYFVAHDSPHKNAFRNFKVGQKLWARGSEENTWEKVELQEKCAAGGWNVKFASHDELFYLPSSALHAIRPPASPTKVLSSASSSSSSVSSTPSSTSSRLSNSKRKLKALVSPTTPKKNSAKVSKLKKQDETVKQDVVAQTVSKQLGVENLGVGAKLWTKDTDGTWAHVELRELVEGGWNVKFPGYAPLYYVLFSELCVSPHRKRGRPPKRLDAVPDATAISAFKKQKTTTPVAKRQKTASSASKKQKTATSVPKKQKTVVVPKKSSIRQTSSAKKAGVAVKQRKSARKVTVKKR